MYANIGTNASTFTLYLKSTVTTASIFTFTWVFFAELLLSKNNLKYLYFYLSTNVKYFFQHYFWCAQTSSFRAVFGLPIRNLTLAISAM